MHTHVDWMNRNGARVQSHVYTAGMTMVQQMEHLEFLKVFPKSTAPWNHQPTFLTMTFKMHIGVFCLFQLG